MSPKALQPIKKYRRYTDPGIGKKTYRPTYRGVELPRTANPPTPWSYDNASDAQAHAERHEVRKQRQVQRLRKEKYRDEVLARYAALLLAQEKQDE